MWVKRKTNSKQQKKNSWIQDSLFQPFSFLIHICTVLRIVDCDTIRERKKYTCRARLEGHAARGNYVRDVPLILAEAEPSRSLSKVKQNAFFKFSVSFLLSIDLNTFLIDKLQWLAFTSSACSCNGRNGSQLTQFFFVCRRQEICEKLWTKVDETCPFRVNLFDVL